MKQGIIGWHQQDHTQIIRTLLQTGNHTSTSSLNHIRQYMNIKQKGLPLTVVKIIRPCHHGLETLFNSLQHTNDVIST